MKVELSTKQTLEEIVSSLLIKEATDLDIFLKGIQYQQKKMYSEEEVRELVENYERDKFCSPTPLTFNRWFNKFKNK